MAVVANRRSSMILFSHSDAIQSHRVRFVMAEKGIAHDTVFVEEGEMPEDLVDVSPYQDIPTLVDRDLSVYEPGVILEYLDERYPHPPLMPVDPVGRAKVRITSHRFERDWYSLADIILTGTPKKVEKARAELTDSLTAADPLFAGEVLVDGEFSLADCTVAPLLWRLEKLGVKLPPRARHLRRYMDRLFDRASFQVGMTEQERELV